jgi:hypothetical protein
MKKVISFVFAIITMLITQNIQAVEHEVEDGWRVYQRPYEATVQFQLDQMEFHGVDETIATINGVQYNLKKVQVMGDPPRLEDYVFIADENIVEAAGA